MLAYINTCQQLTSNNIDYRFFTDSVKDLSGASLVVLNLVSESNKSKTTVKALSGFSEELTQLYNAIGFNLEGTDWDGNYDKINITEKNKLILFNSFNESGYMDAVPKMTGVLKLINEFFSPGELYSMDFEYQGVFLGIMTLIIPKDKKIQNKDLIEIYMSQVSGTIKRLRAESKLQQKVLDLQLSEHKIRTYLEESPLGIFITDNDGHFIRVNKAACQMSGYTEIELLSSTTADLLAPEFLDEGKRLFETIAQQGPAQADLLLQKKDNETFWINLSAVKIDDNQVISFCQDITERKQKEERSKELHCLHSFSQMLQVQGNNLDNVLKETVKLLPPAFEYPENIGICIVYYGREFKSKGYIATPWKATTNIELNGKPIGSIDVCYFKPPQYKHESFSNEEKLMLRTISEHLSRVTARSQAIEELQKSRNQLATTLHSIGDGVIVTDVSGRVTRMNERAENLTGWTANDAIDKPLHDVFVIVNEKTGNIVSNPVYGVLKTGRNHALADNTILISRDETRCFIADSAAPIRDDEGKMYGAIMVFSDITNRKRAEASLMYQFSFEKMLANISNSFASESSEKFEHTIKYALEQIGVFFQVDRSYVFQFFENGLRMSNTHEWCADEVEPQIAKMKDIPLDAFPWWSEQILQKKHVNIPDVDILPAIALAEKLEFKSQKIRSLLSIPMIRNGIVFGFLGLDAVKERKVWTDNQIMLLTVVVELVGHAYIRNFEEMKVRYQSYHDSLTGLYNRSFLEMEMDRLDTRRQLPIGLIMADLNGLKLFNDTFGHVVGDELLRQAAIVLKSCCRKEDITARWGGDEFIIFLPQTTEEDVKAILDRINARCNETFVNGISLSLSVGHAIKNENVEDLFDILKKAEENMYKHKREESHYMKKSLLRIMLKKLEEKSSETETHYATMKKVAHLIGKQVGLSHSQLDKLYLLVSLHDIGEITVPEEILNKKEALTEDEWEVIKKHPETGFSISRATEGISHIAEEILSHHERWDGKGYPRGLVGNEIPLLARITAIADAYEVMSSGRTYKRTMTKNEIIDELRRCAGSQFDPELIEVFLLLL